MSVIKLNILNVFSIGQQLQSNCVISTDDKTLQQDQPHISNPTSRTLGRSTQFAILERSIIKTTEPSDRTDNRATRTNLGSQTASSQHSTEL